MAVAKDLRPMKDLHGNRMRHHRPEDEIRNKAGVSLSRDHLVEIDKACNRGVIRSGEGGPHPNRGQLTFRKAEPIGERASETTADFHDGGLASD